jgi:hypothetical protein
MFNFGNSPGLLGYQQPQGGLLGGGTQNLMQQYLMNLFMRRYQPPAIPQQPGMVSSQMGPGGMQYQAPQIPNVPLPGAQQPASQSAGYYGPSVGANSYDPLAYLRHMSQFEGGG